MRALIFLLLFSLTSLFPDEIEVKSVEDIEDYATLIDFEGLPSSVVQGCVNVITGNYFESSDDLVTVGPNPVTISRYYDSSSKHKGVLGDIWAMNLDSRVVLDKPAFVTVENSGSSICYCSGRDKEFKLEPSILEAGVVNICSPYASGRYHLKNKRLEPLESKCIQPLEEEGYDLVTSGGDTLRFGMRYFSEKRLLSNIIHGNGCKIQCAYKRGKLRALTSLSQRERPVGDVELIRLKEANKVKFRSNDGKEVCYTIAKMKSKHKNGKHRRILKSVESNFQPKVEYDYIYFENNSRERIAKKTLPDNRFLRIRYNDKRKVGALLAPVGVDSKPVMIQKFSYHKKMASVWNALRVQKNYYWTKEKRLSAIEEFLERKLYRKEQLIWGEKKSKDYTFLKARLFKDQNDSCLLAKTFTYDDRGNILKECLSGNLSGRSAVSINIDKKGNLRSASEKHEKKYTYNAQNLVLTEDDGRKCTRYIYYKDSTLLREKLLSDKKGIFQRHYFEYDANGLAHLEIIDDGTTTDINNFHGVTERYVKRLNTWQNPFGLPTIIAEFYVDLKTKKEVLIKKTVNTYTKEGHLAKETVFDSRNKIAYSKQWIYDEAGNVIEETNAAGVKAFYQYDANGNCVLKKTPVAEYRYTYDFSNRLILEEEISAQVRLSKAYSYDLLGQKTKAVDFYGNETLFFYDDLGRLIKRCLPAIVKEGELIYPEETFCYNALNHPIEKTDVLGNVTKTSCNAYGKPTRVEHLDGSVQCFYYDLDGLLKETVDSFGTRTLYEYDSQGRKTYEEKISAKGISLFCQQWIYNSFHLTEYIDSDGELTSYRYNAQGQLTVEIKGEKETHYFYDTLGRKKEVKERYAPKKYRNTCYAYDVLDQVIEESVKDHGTVFLKKQYAYDCMGNRIRETLFTDKGSSTTQMTYDAQKRPVKGLAPDGSVTHFRYNYVYRNELGQCVPHEEIIDAKGTVTTLVKNTHDKVVLEELTNAVGKVIKSVRCIFDAQGNLLQRIEGKNITAFAYDAMGQEIAIFEAYGTPLQKVTRKKYKFSLLKKIVKPDGVVLDHSYDAFGRLKVLSSSDGSIHYRYSYDHSDNIIQAEDLIRKTVTKRSFCDGEMVEEILDQGLKLEYSYDFMGRLTELKLPDLSSISYSYDANFLREVRRKSRVHRYHYSFGKLQKVSLPASLGEVHYAYDSCLRPIKIVSSYAKMQASYDALGNLLKMDTLDPLGEKKHSFTYDAFCQLVAEDGSASHRYAFDALGNRTKKDKISYTSNCLNQLTAQGKISYSYDRNGNLVKRGNVNYRYDALNRIIEVNDGVDKTLYSYDPMHRRTAKTLYRKGKKVSQHKYLYQLDKEIGAYIDGKLTQLRVLGVGCQGDVGAAVLMELDGKTYVPLHDYRGSVIALINAETKECEEVYRYTSFGEEAVTDSLGNAILPKNPWRFSSKRVDEETGWSFYGRRHYDPEIGRFTTPDPLWFVDGTNLYCFAKNSPMRFIDPDGLFIKDLLNLLVDTVCAIFEWMGTCDMNFVYKNGSLTFAVEEGGPPSFDKKSHLICDKEGATFGSVYFVGTNGIRNTLRDGIEGKQKLSELASGAPSVFVYNATHGLWDLVEAFIQLLGFETRTVRLQRKGWDACFAQNPKAIIIEECHSHGSIIVRNALRGYDPELRKRIHVIAIAPGGYIDKDICGSIQHLVSTRDFIPLFDFMGRMRNKDTTLLLNPHPEAAWLDHSMDSPTYKQAIQDRIEWIREHYEET